MVDELSKIVVDLPVSDLAATAETLFAACLQPGKYQLKNVPIWAYGLAYEDIVEGRLEDDGRIHFVRVIGRSGLLTVRIAGPDADPTTYRALVELLRASAIATETYSPTYSVFAMDTSRWQAIEATIAQAERSGNLFVEIANEPAGS